MEYQKIASLLNDESYQPSKFRTRNWVEIDDDVRDEYSPNKQIRFKTARSSSCDYSDACILVEGNILVSNTAGAGAAANNTNKKVIFKNCAPFTRCISKINNEQIYNAEYIDIVMSTHSLIEYSDNFSKTSGSLWQYCILTWSAKCVIIYTNANGQVPTFTITETNLYVPVVTLSTQDNAKLLPQLKSDFKRTITWNKYIAKPELLAENVNLNHLIEPSF